MRLSRLGEAGRDSVEPWLFPKKSNFGSTESRPAFQDGEFVKEATNRIPIVRLLLAGCGGLLLSAAFPGIGLAGAGWIAPGIILMSAVGCGARKAFRLGYVAGLAHFLSSLYWLVSMPDTFHGIPLAPAAAWLALSAYCALFPAVWVWLCWRIWRAPVAAPDLSARAALDQFFSAGLARRAGWALCAGLIWVALEMARGRLWSGFPWNFLAVSQYKMLPFIQMTAVTGVYGLSFLMVWTSVSVVVALIVLTRQPGRGVWAEAGVPMLVTAGIASFGAYQVAAIPRAEEELNVVLIQPSIPQTLIWDPKQDEALFQNLLKLSESALTDKASLLLWPEGAWSSLTPPHQEAVARLVAGHKVWLVANANTIGEGGQGTEEPVYNSSLLISPAGELEGVYHKRRLVIFGEYAPKWLPFLKWLTPIDGAFTSGTDAVQFKMKNPDAQFSVLICFEDMFPEEAREHVTPETDFLVNLTNDGWFGEGAEQWQQAANAVFRAVENGVPLVRCTNNGLTCWADAQGRLREIFAAAGNVYGAGFLAARIPLRAGGDRRGTFYNRHGDWFGWSCCAMSLCLCAGSFRLRRAVPCDSVPI
jgi:apolipoprotein N-acyltransferase